MKIIKDGKLEFDDKTFGGECRICGCIFEATVGIAKGNDGSRFLKNIDHLPELRFSRASDSDLICNCPCCLKCPVTLKEHSKI